MYVERIKENYKIDICRYKKVTKKRKKTRREFI